MRFWQCYSYVTLMPLEKTFWYDVGTSCKSNPQKRIEEKMTVLLEKLSTLCKLKRYFLYIMLWFILCIVFVFPYVGMLMFMCNIVQYYAMLWFILCSIEYLNLIYNWVEGRNWKWGWLKMSMIEIEDEWKWGWMRVLGYFY